MPKHHNSIPAKAVGHMDPGLGPRPATVEDQRLCVYPGCKTRLSRYNPHATHCFVHKPTKHARNRGRKIASPPPAEQQQKQQKQNRRRYEFCSGSSQSPGWLRGIPFCRECERKIALNTDGTIRRHGRKIETT